MSIKTKAVVGGSALLLTGGLAAGLLAVTGGHGTAPRPGAAAPGASHNGQNVDFDSSSPAPPAVPSGTGGAADEEQRPSPPAPTAPAVITYKVANHTGTDGQVCARDFASGNSLGCSDNVPVAGKTDFKVTVPLDVHRVALTAKMNDGKVNDNLSLAVEPQPEQTECLTIQDQKFDPSSFQGRADVDFRAGCVDGS